jgi:hypothetical protein
VLLRHTLMRRGEVEILERLAEFELSLTLEVHTQQVSTTNGRVEVEALAVVRTAGGLPALVVGQDGRLRLAGFEDVDVEASPQRLLPRVTLVLRHRRTKEHRLVTCIVSLDRASGQATAEDAVAQARLRVVCTVDPESPGEQPLGQGTWDLFLRTEDGLVGRKLTTRLAAPADAPRTEPRTPEHWGAGPTLYTTADGNASLKVARSLSSGSRRP